MLSPEYLKYCTSYLLGMMDRINEQVIADIARRIIKAGRLTGTAEFQVEMLRQQNKLFDDVIKDVARYIEMEEQEIRQIFLNAHFENMESENLRALNAGKTPIDYANNSSMGKLLTAHMLKTSGDVKNLTKTTALQSQNAFIRAVGLANMQVSSGVFTYDFAIKNAIKQVAVRGMTVQYPTGHVDKLDVAVRRAVLTGVNQSAAELNMMYCKEIGTDLVEVTAHIGARPSHAVWQGQVYSLSGRSKGYDNFVDATGYGTGEGLCGWNCRHNFYAYYEGTERAYSDEDLKNLDKERYEYDGRTYTNYEANQRQRFYERAIRQEKRYLTGLNAAYDETSDKALKQNLRAEMEGSAVILKEREAKLKRFCKATDRKVDKARVQVHAVKTKTGKIVGFDRSAAQRAKQLATKGTHEFANIEKSLLKKLSAAEKKVLKHGRRTNTEMLMWLNKDNSEALPFRTGTKSSVQISKSDCAFLKSKEKDSIISLHNHPSSGSFSYADMNIMCEFPSIKEMKVIGHDGTRYTLSVGSGMRPNGSVIEQAYFEILNSTQHKYQKMFNKTKNQREVWKKHSHEVVEQLAKRFGWKYERK